MIDLWMFENDRHPTQGFAPLKTGTPIFNFGTMRDQRVLQAVLGRDLNHLKIVPGTLVGYEARRIKGEQHPAAVRVAGAELRGIVVSGLTRDDVARINLYEGGDYGIERRMVHTANGLTECQVYIPTRLLVERQRWDFGLYQRQVPGYLRLVRRWMAERDGSGDVVDSNHVDRSALTESVDKRRKFRDLVQPWFSLDK